MTDANTTAPPQFMLERAEALAFRHYKDDRLQMAASVLERILKYRPERDDLWTLLGVIERRRDNYRDSVICLRKALELDNENVNAAINLAEVLVSMGQVPTGVDLLQGIFEEGRDPALEPAEQNEYVIRAGAQLAFIKDTINALRNNPEIREALSK